MHPSETRPQSSSNQAAMSLPASEWRILGAYDYGGFSDGNGPYSDMLIRRPDFSDTVVWYLKGNAFQGGKWAGPNDCPTCPLVPFGDPRVPGYIPSTHWRTIYDQQWKIAGQELGNPTSRLASLSSLPFGQMTASITTSSYSLNWNLPLLLAVNAEYKIRVKKVEENTWQLLATLNSSSLSSYGGSYTFDPNERYDFNVSFYQVQGSVRKGGVAQTSVAISAKPIENRGGVLLLVDQVLQASHGSQMNQIISDLSKDLTGDGWNVVVGYAPRHDDSDYTSQTGFKINNYDKLAGITNTIKNAYNNYGVRTILIIGHVVIPYSGYNDPDNHGFRAGPADLYYGDRDGVWTDSSTQTTLDAIPEESQFGPGDGRMDQSKIPPLADGVTFNGLELAVGRVDFARMPSPNNTTQAEVNLIGAYFSKARKYRMGTFPSYPVSERAAAWSWGPFMSDPHQMVGRFRSVLGTDPSLIVSANALMQQSASYILGYTAGRTTSIDGYTPYSPGVGDVRLWHRAEDFAIPERVPKVAMNFIFCSYHWNWNRQGNILKGLLAGQDYPVATIWDPGLWQMQALALGETLGAAQIKNVQEYTAIRTEYPGLVIDQDDRISGNADATYFAIMGDPTLRLHYLRPPPSPPTVEGTTISWTASAEPGFQYLAYRKNGGTGLYERIESSSQPVGCCSATLTPTEAQSTSFMVRAVKSVTTGSGSYQALSQGAF